MLLNFSADLQRMKLRPPSQLSALTLILCALCVLCTAQVSLAADKFVFPGAIIRARGQTAALPSVNASFAHTQAASGFDIQKLGSGVLLINEKSEDSPQGRFAPQRTQPSTCGAKTFAEKQSFGA